MNCVDNFIYQFPFPFIGSNMYLILDCVRKEALIIDPHRNDEAEQLLKKAGVEKTLVLLTHEHFDHTSGIPWLRERFQCHICCHRNALDGGSQRRNNRPVLAYMLNDKFDNQKALKEYFRKFKPYTYVADQICGDETAFIWNSHKVCMRYAPGHSPASVLIGLDQKYVFTGDSLIPGVQVITRFPGGSREMYETVTFPLLKGIEKDVMIMPGHGEPVEYRKLICENGVFTVISKEESHMWDLKKYGNNRVFVGDKKEIMTYRELEDFSDRFYKAVGERTLLFILCTNTIGSVAGYVSCINRKVVPALLSSGIDRDLLDRLIENYQPPYLWCPENHDLTKRYKKIFREKGYCLLETGYKKKYELFPELALLLTTSGSTGSPKFVRQSYLNIRSNAESIAEYLEIGADERSITTLPMNYTYGLSIINSHILKGASIILTEFGMMQKEFWQLLKSEKATSFGGVPYTYEMLVKLRFFNMDLPYLRYMTQAGGKLSPKLHRQFAEYAVQTQKKFIVMYGQCEATARMSYLPAEKSLEKYGSVGVAIPGGRFSLIDVDGKEITEPNVEGELVYTGANVTLGYAEKKDDLKEGDTRYGILETGDMAKRDKDGFYYIVGRKKRFLKVYGNRLNLDEVSTLLKERFDNLECTSGGMDDHVYIFITDDSYKSDAIRSYLAEKTGLNQKAFTVMTIEELPKNEAGKIRYKELEKYYSV